MASRNDNTNEDVVIDEGTYKERLAMAQQAATDRAEQGFRDYAKQVYLYFAALVDAGFTPEQAERFTMSFQQVFLASVFPAKS